MPPAAARSRMASDVGSSHWNPKVIVPRQRRDTERPVRPRRVWRIMSPRFLEEEVDVLRRDQVGYGPAVEIVLGHALLGEAPELLRLAARLGHLQRQDADGLGGTGVVAFVELVPATELGSHGVPEQLHEFDALDRAGPVGAAQVLLQIRAQRRRPEVDGVRVEIDQAARQDVFGELLDTWIGDRGEDTIGLSML